MSLAKLVWFVITNLPTIIKFAKDVIDFFDGDTRLAKECVGELCEALPKTKPEVKDEVVKATKRRLLRKKAEREKRRREL